MSSLFKLNVVVTLVALLGIGIGSSSTDGVPTSYEPGESATELASLELPALPDECLDACVYCDDVKHACHVDAGLGGSYCPHEEQCTEQGDCEDHKCDPEFASAALEARDA